jgi:hypothetical protein
LREILRRLDRAPVLTVGESEGFAQAGGMIGFAMVDEKVKFEIDADAASRCGLKLNATLLQAARRRAEPAKEEEKR